MDFQCSADQVSPGSASQGETRTQHTQPTADLLDFTNGWQMLILSEISPANSEVVSNETIKYTYYEQIS